MLGNIHVLYSGILGYLPLFAPLAVVVFSIAHRWASGQLQVQPRSLLRIHADLVVGMFSFLMWAVITWYQRDRIALNPELIIPHSVVIVLLVLSLILAVVTVKLRSENARLRADITVLVITVLAFSLPVVLAEKDPEHFRIGFLSSRDVAGTWTWDYPEDKWRGEIVFRDVGGKLAMGGKVFQFQSENRRMILYEIEEGTAEIVDQRGLVFRCRVKDRRRNRDLVWETDGPLRNGLAFEGSFRATSAGTPDPTLTTYPWGISLRKSSY